ncbi:patatin-like phospholipase family protein [Burkholderiaceae bacterium DAT-1]|nr:patatin-like phospholipase family protein [Burkholderiaceae bacterium DAT-1]
MSKVGIALAGGGPLGGIYEIGALTALEDALQGFDFTEADIYVGVSSGGFISAALANGIKPSQLAAMLIGRSADDVFDPNILMRPAFSEYWRRVTSIPGLMWEAFTHYLQDPWRHGLFESMQQLGKAIPTGIFDNKGIDELLREMFTRPGRSNDFRQLKHKLYLVATELDSGESISFGEPGYDHVPISTAVQASAALPGLFPPVQIDGHDYVDGALIKTLHASVALKEGANLVLCVNPLVPFDTTLAREHGRNVGALMTGGLPVVLSQTFRAIIHSRMQVGMDRYRHQYKDADVLLFEPRRDDGDMFFANVFSYQDRNRLCEHAYQRTRQSLYERRKELAPILKRHGITLDIDALKDHRRTLLNDIQRDAHEELSLTATALDNTLNALELWLTRMQAQQQAQQQSKS